MRALKKDGRKSQFICQLNVVYLADFLAKDKTRIVLDVLCAPS
jgi:hypothetical protein